MDMSKTNYSKHFKSSKHLRHWAKEVQNSIYNYKKLLQKELKDIKQGFDKNNYNFFDNVYLTQIGKKRYVRNLEN